MLSYFYVQIYTYNRNSNYFTYSGRRFRYVKKKNPPTVTGLESEKKKKSLIISGARQVGKTFIIREFSKEYGSFIELNFLENPSLISVFSGDLDVETLLTNLSFYFKNQHLSQGIRSFFLMRHKNAHKR